MFDGLRRRNDFLTLTNVAHARGDVNSVPRIVATLRGGLRGMEPNAYPRCEAVLAPVRFQSPLNRNGGIDPVRRGIESDEETIASVANLLAPVL